MLMHNHKNNNNVREMFILNEQISRRYMAMRKYFFILLLPILLFVFSGCGEALEELVFDDFFDAVHNERFNDEEIADIVGSTINSLQRTNDLDYIQRHIIESFVFVTQNEDARYVLKNIHAGYDYEAAAQIMRNYVETTQSNFTMAINEEAGIAYFDANFFPFMWPFLGSSFYNPIISFFHDISDFDHFIIDLRGTRGTNAFEFMQFVVRTNIRAEDSFPTGVYVFMSEEESGGTADGLVLEGRVVTSTENMLSRFDLPHLNMDNVAGLEFAIRDIITFQPFYLNENHSFVGQIWILIDDNMDFGPKTVAWLSQDAGFANLVGDMVYFDIANHPRLSEITGDFYVTDHLGNTLDYIVPSFPNRSGMDALETTLTLIDEGSH